MKLKTDYTEYDIKRLSDKELLYLKSFLEEDASRFNSLQTTAKVNLNSSYGTMGSPYFRFYDVRLASAITLTGQLAIQWAQKVINDYLNKLLKNKERMDYVVASDTDSIYVSFDHLISVYCPVSTDDEKLEFIETITNDRIAKVLSEGFDELMRIMGAEKNLFQMKRETISNVGFWTAKKRYALNVLVDETGKLPEPKIKVTGLESVRSTYPEIARKALKKGVETILLGTNEDAFKLIEEMREQFHVLPIEEIATPKGVADIKKWEDANGLISGTPIQVRAAHLYNREIMAKGLNNKYPVIRDGDKLKYVYLTEPNPLREDVFGFIHSFPAETGLLRYVDRDQQFEKMFFKPFSSMLHKVGWDSKRQQKLGKFYKDGIKRSGPKG